MRRSGWPNLSRGDLVTCARAWAAREGAELLVVFDGDAPDNAPDLVGSRRRSADDLIAELDGPFWLATSDRELRDRVGPRAERFLGGGSFLAELRETQC